MGRLFWFFLSTVFYTYFGYPLLLTIMAQTRPKKQIYPPLTPSVTLLIAAHNEQAIIAEKLQNSLALDYPHNKLQILVTADGSDDRTPDIVREFAHLGVELTYLPPRRGKMAAINRAMPLARGEIVLFSDANNMYSSDILRQLVAPFADPTVGIVTGGKAIISGDGALGESEGLYWKYESFVKQQETRLGCCAAVAGEIMAIRRSLFQPQSEHVLTDDTHLALEIIGRGYRVIYVPEARSYERVSVSARDEMTRRARIFAGRYQELTLIHKVLSWRRPLVSWEILSHQSIRTLVPVAMAGALITNIMAIFWPIRQTKRPIRDLTPPFNWIILLSQLIFYGMAWIGSQKEREGLAGKLLYLPTFMVNLNIAGLMGLYNFLAGHNSPLWKRAKRRESL